MTDKQIIIDGIDVTGCEYCSRYADTTIYHCDWIGECKEHPNCHYKQLQRKEQECEELKKQLESAKGLVTVGNRQLAEALEENEELKENLSDLKKDLKFQNDKISELELDLQNANSTIENLDLMRVGEYNTLIDDYDKLKQTLAEIKEIAKHCIKQDICTICDYSDKCHIEDEEIPTYDVCKLILQKINEVEDE